jgi:hypothetical protein
MKYKHLHRAMVDFVRPLVADVVLNGMAVLSVGFVGYLVWLRFEEKRQVRQQRRARERARKNHWGYL